MDPKKPLFDLSLEFNLETLGLATESQLASTTPNDLTYYKPPFISLPSYEDESVLRDKIPSLKYFNLNHAVNEFTNAVFYVIRSKKTDDIHKAVKYGVWTSSPQNNNKIRDSFNQKSKTEGNVFFVFTYLGASGFVGLARLVDVDLKREFPFWGEIGRWIGVMRLEWVYVRDVEFHNVLHLKEQSPMDKSYRPLSDLTDGTRLSDSSAKELVRIFNEKQEPSSVLKKFPGHDHQEQKLRHHVDEIIRSNTMESYKKQIQKKEEQRIAETPKPEEAVEVVIKKKVSQAELKKQRKQQMKDKESNIE